MLSTQGACLQYSSYAQERLRGAGVGACPCGPCSKEEWGTVQR